MIYSLGSVQYTYNPEQGSDRNLLLFPLILILYPLYVVITRVSLAFLKRKYFHFSLGDQYLHVRQGVLSREQRNLPYSAIQDVIISKSLFERLFGLATLQIENAVRPGLTDPYASTQIMAIGTYANKLIIPGLSKADAENLKNEILQKTRDVTQIDSQSGL